MSAITLNSSFYFVNTIDPTRTLSIRHRYVADMNRRFKLLMADIYEAIVDQDVFGLNQQNIAVNASGVSTGQFAFPSDQQKVESFVQWLKNKNEEYLLSSGKTSVQTISTISSVGRDARQVWQNTYLNSAYQQGIKRARQELKKKGVQIDDGEMEQGSIQVAFNGPIHADRIGLIQTRAYSSLKGITADMESTVSDVLAMGMVDGKNPRELAKLLDKAITGKGESLAIIDSLGRKMSSKRRAEILARTEVIRAHHAANMGEYRSAGALGINILAEHLTAGDARVCPICSPLNGKKYKLEDAEYIIPVHPQCRCVAIPYIKDEENTRPVRKTKKVKKAGIVDPVEKAKQVWERKKELLQIAIDSGINRKTYLAERAERKAYYKYMNIVPEEVYQAEREKMIDYMLDTFHVNKRNRKKVIKGSQHIPIDLLDELQRKVKIIFGRTNRSYYSPTQKLISFSDNVDYTVIGHELAHAIDDLFSGWRRTGGHWKAHDLKWVKKKDGTNFKKWFHSNHNGSKSTYANGDGFFFQDNWLDDYEGRIYEGGVGEEWWAMNVQRYTKFREYVDNLFEIEIEIKKMEIEGTTSPLLKAALQKKLDDFISAGAEEYALDYTEWESVRETYPELAEFIETKLGGRLIGNY